MPIIEKLNFLYLNYIQKYFEELETKLVTTVNWSFPGLRKPISGPLHRFS